MLGGISIWQLAIVLVIVILLFGTKKLKNLGSDLGAAIKGFKDEYKKDEEQNQKNVEQSEQNPQINSQSAEQVDAQNKVDQKKVEK